MDEQQRAQIFRRLAKRLGAMTSVVEDDQFIRCDVCGQFFDLQDFTEVYYHDDRLHPPMKPDA